MDEPGGAAGALRRLKAALAAVEGRRPDVLAAVPTTSLRATLAARGWRLVFTEPKGGEPAWEVYDCDRPTLNDGRDPLARLLVERPPGADWADRDLRVADLVAAIARREGASAAEVLAQAMAHAEARRPGRLPRDPLAEEVERLGRELAWERDVVVPDFAAQASAAEGVPTAPGAAVVSAHAARHPPGWWVVTSPDGVVCTHRPADMVWFATLQRANGGRWRFVPLDDTGLACAVPATAPNDDNIPF